MNAAPPGLVGLTEDEAAARRHVSGSNAIAARRTTAAAVFVRQFLSPFDALLLGVAALSAALHQATDATIVLSIVLISAVLGTRNEYRAERIIEHLRARISRTAAVLRSGVLRRIDVAEIVPGDVVALSVGDAVPADLSIRVAVGLECDESALTGESRPVEKLAGGDAYMGTSVSGGMGYGVVVATGKDTRFGTIAAHAARRPPQTAFEKGLRSFSLLLLYITVVVSATVLGVSVLLHRSVVESLLFALAISVSLTPQMLPVIVSVSLSLGAYRMAKMGAVVKRLITIEDIGNVNVLFTDKTGTLSSGQLTLQGALDAHDSESETIRLYALLCNSAPYGGDPRAAVNALDLALWQDVPPALDARLKQSERIAEVPFDFERRLMSVLARVDEERVLIVKGAPEAILQRCTDAPATAQAQVDTYLDQGARVLAVAVRPFDDIRAPQPADERDLHFAGVLVFADPPKPDVAAALAQLQQLNVRVKVITGDHERAARILCARVGLQVAGSINGPELETMTDDILRRRLPSLDLFARISPLQKERIVRLQRETGEDVGFLGDGINDVLALRIADVGISVDSAADVAKDASDLVLMTKDLGLLAGGVAEGRRIFANTIKYVLMATSSNFGNMISTAIGAMILPFLPLLPSQVLLNNLLYDTSEMTIPSDRVDPERLIRPSHWNLRFVRRFMLAFGPFSAISDFAMFAYLTQVAHAAPAAFRSGFFIETFATQVFMVFVLRTRRVPFFASRPGRQLTITTLLCGAVGIVLPFTPLAPLLGFAPVPFKIAGVTMAIIIAYVAAVEATKVRFFRNAWSMGRSAKRAPDVPVRQGT